METTKKIGDAGEDLAAIELEKVGYKIVARNFRTRFGEIDIIAEEDGVLVFVEVKAKRSDRFGTAAEMITRTKLEKIIRTAQTYIIENDYKGAWRIDAVLINGQEIELLKNIS